MCTFDTANRYNGRMPRPSVALVLLSILGLTTIPAPAQPTQRPNFVLLLADDLGYGDLGCYGHPVLKTPRLDRLAAEGVRFTQFYAAAPVCSPSRAAMMTGRVPNRLGIRDWIPLDSGIFLKTEETTFAELLRGAGYRTGFAGKWHLNSRFNGQEPTPGDHGFDHWLATQNNTAHASPANFVRNGRRVGRLDKHASQVVVDEGLSFIDAGPKDQPFLLCVWFHAPHERVDSPAEFEAHYAHVDNLTKREYFGSVEYVDHQVGRLLDGLEQRGLRDNTFVLFTSDNGPETLHRYDGSERCHGSAGGLRGMKLHLYEGGLRVPAIVRWPAGGRRTGVECTEPAGGVDLLPTFAALAGCDLPRTQLDGQNVLPLFNGQRFGRQRPLYWQYDVALSNPWKVAMRDGPFKLLADERLERFALFNLDTDPTEQHDLAAGAPDKVREMSARLKQLHADVNGRRQGTVPLDQK